MKKLFGKGIITLSASFAIMFGSTVAYAIPADPRPKTFTQPDGSTVTVKIRGDEHNHFYLTEDDYLLVREKDAFYYANVDAAGTIVKSEILATSKATRSAQARQYLSQVDMGKVFECLRTRAESHRGVLRAPATQAVATPGSYTSGLFQGTHFPAKGKQKALVVLVEYKDKKFKLDDPYDYFSRMLNQEGFSDYGGTGSAYDFFKQNSRGQFDPEFDVYGPLTLSRNMSYYGGNDWWGNDQHAYEMAIEACQQLDDTVDFSEYDRDGNGYIDNVYIFYAGMGEASGGSADTVWPHSWDISSATDEEYYFDGVKLERYGCSNEWETGRPDGVGTFVHEFSHVLGLPDLYATSYTGAFTPGNWSALDSGPYNNDGCTPPNYGAFERTALGWLNPTILDGPCSVTLDKITTNQAFIIQTSKKDEYFLLENRQKTGWDEFIPGHGMLIWHVDYDENTWTSNTVNNESSHQHVDIEEADGTTGEGSRDGDAFPGLKNVTSFTDDTKPSMRTWSNQRLELPITNITEESGIIKFDVAGGYIELDPVTLSEAENITGSTFDVSWTECENADGYLVSVYQKIVSGDRETRSCVEGWNRKNVGLVNNITVTGLDAETLYYCVVNAAYKNFASDDSNEIIVTTGAPTVAQRTAVAEEATDVEGSTFVANWQEIEGADCYYLNVYTKEDFTTDTDICDFTGGIRNMPEGWTTNSKLTYANEAYSGDAAPSLRLAAADAYVSTPVYTSDALSISFWMRGSSVDPENTVRVYSRINKKNVLIAEYSISNEVGGEVITIDELPEGTRAVRIEYHENVHKGSVAIDDIHVVWNLHQPEVLVEGFDPYEAGNTLSCIVTGLEPLTTYYYTVVAGDGELRSKVSNEIEVTTTEGAGISDVTYDANISVNTDKITVTTKADTTITVYDLTGRRVAEAMTDSNGHATLQAGCNGVYIVRYGHNVSKIIIK